MAREQVSAGHLTRQSSAEGRVQTFRVEELSIGGQRQVVVDPSGAQREILTGSDGSRTTLQPNGVRTTTVSGPDPRFGMLAPIASRATNRTPAGLTLTVTRLSSFTIRWPLNWAR